MAQTTVKYNIRVILHQTTGRNEVNQLEFGNLKERIERQFDMTKWSQSEGYSNPRLTTYIRNVGIEIMILVDKDNNSLIVVEWWNSRKMIGSTTTHRSIESAATSIRLLIEEYDPKMIRPRQSNLFEIK